MTNNLIKLPDGYYYLLGDKKPNVNDYIILDNRIKEIPDYNGLHLVKLSDENLLNSALSLKIPAIIASNNPSLNLPDILGLELVGEVDAAKEYAKNKYGEGYYPDIEQAYNQCKEDNKDKVFTEMDILKAIAFGFSICKKENRAPFNKEQLDFIKSLSKEKTEWNVEIEMENNQPKIHQHNGKDAVKIIKVLP